MADHHVLFYAPLAQLDRAWVFYTNGCRFEPYMACHISGEQHAPKTNLLPPRLGIFRFLYGERVSEVWEGGGGLVLLHL